MPPIHSTVTVLLAALCVLSAVPAVAGAQSSTDPTSEFVVSLAADGDAEVSLTLTYDLTSEAAHTAFERLRENGTARQQFADEYATSLDRVAKRTGERVGREMHVEAPAVTLTTTDGVGVVELSAVWRGLATVDGERLVIAEPFGGEFAPDRRFVVRAPAGYAFTSVEPDATAHEASRVEWAPGVSLDGFRVVASPDAVAAPTTADSARTDATTDVPETDPGTSSADGAGFGVVVGILAVGLAVGLAARRRR